MAQNHTRSSVQEGRGRSDDGPVFAAVTLSARGQAAAATAMEVAEKTGRSLEICQVVETDCYRRRSTEMIKDLEVVARSLAAGRAVGCDVELRCFPEHYADQEFGRAVCIIDAASAEGSSLIVIGPQNPDAEARPFTGTMTHNLIQHLPCPLLIAANNPRRGYDRVMVAVDFSDVCEDLIREAVKIAPAAELHLVYAADEGEADQAEASEKLQALVASALGEVPEGLNVVEAVVPGPPKKVLTQVVQDVLPDLLVMGTRGRTGLRRIVLGSVAAKFVDAPPCDLLVLRSR